MTPKSPHSSARLVRRTLALALLGVTPLTFAAMSHDLMPAPAQLRLADGRLPVTAEFSVALRGHDDARLRRAIARALRRWEERTGFTFRRTAEAAYVFATDVRSASLVIDCAAPSGELPALGDDESYTLDVRGAQAVLHAPTTLGVLRGLETLLQLLHTDAQGWFVPAARIEDRP
ncbi:MAG TPA: glycoside hydrolase family 20 zincin-like fold domain-containing protein, partial [Opitutus sp.]|nr:glycoside hydrolase family 20 zincin-like fold domain-containing protein [Opitutus sp.]